MRPRQLLRTSAGLILIVAGGLGLVLPIVPGIPLLLAGFATLGTDHPVRMAVMRWLRRSRIIPDRPEDRTR